jgi:hypothetical protein
MWPYWLMFLVPAIAATTERSTMVGKPGAAKIGRVVPVGWVIATVAVAVMVGYRVEVGGDWFNYFGYLDAVFAMPFWDVLTLPDPGYHLLSWLSVEMGWGMIGLNAMSGAIFAVGLAVFCRSLPRPWLALTVAIPYMVIVVAMGYSRQGIALAFAMIGLVFLSRGSLLRYLLWVALGATFHKTAVLLLPIGALAQSDRRIWKITWAAAATALAYLLLLADSAEALYAGYVESEYQSEGALVRLLMNAVPGVILLLQWKRFRALPGFSPIWLWFAILSVVLLVILRQTDATTAVDRIALYLLPLQLVVFSALPDAFSHRASRQVWVLLVMIYYAVVQFVFFHFATHAEYWLPYRFYLFEDTVI